MTVIASCDLINEYLISEAMQAFPTILILTTLALILAQFKFMNRFAGAFEISNFSIYLFSCAVEVMIKVKR